MSPIFQSDHRVRETYQFDSFEVRVRDGILLHKGMRVRVQDLPFQMLVLLLKQPGEMVDREELLNRLWTQKNFVDPDSNLRVVAARLREALRDNATEPRYIETVPKRGYRFIGHLEPIADPPADPSPAAEVTAEPVAPIPRESGKRRGLLLPTIGGVLTLAAAALASISIYRYARRPLAGPQDRIAVGEFINSTKDSDFDGTLSAAFRVKLEESPYLSLVPEREFQLLAKASNGAESDSELHACTSAGSQILLRGQIFSQAPGYQVQLTARRCANGRLLTTQKAYASSRNGVLTALDTATENMRRRLGESDTSLQKFDVPLTQAMTGSLTAFKAYTLGEQKRLQGHESESVADYKLAVDLDPEFALAYSRLGTIYVNAQEFSLSRFYCQKAFDLRARTTERERLIITADYYGSSTGEIQRAIEAYQILHSLYPRESMPANDLGYEYILLGQPEKAVDLARTAIQLDPNAYMPYATLAQAYLSSGDYVNARTLCNDPIHGKSDAIQFHQICFLLSFVQDDENGMQRQLEWAHGNPAENTLLESAAWIALYQGKLTEAHHLFSDARQNALKNNLIESAALIDVDEAGFEADLGLPQGARKAALDALELSPESATVQTYAALALARAGDIDRAEAEAKKAGAQAPLDTILNSAGLASVRAAIHLQQNQPEAALQSLEQARPIDFNSLMALAPAYYRGLAYLQTQHPQDATKEFQRVLDHRAIAPDSLYVALSQLELGRAFQLAEDPTNAKRAYHDVENIWRGADPDFPPLKQLHIYRHELTVKH